MRITRVAAILTLVCYAMASNAPGQSYAVTMRWEVSINDGVTWNTGSVECLSSRRSALVRLWAQWNRDSNSVVFALTQFDATVATTGRVSQDQLDSINVGILPWSSGNSGGYSVSRHGSVVKIDDWADVQAPGIGPRWVTPYQLPPATGPQHPENPTILFAYRILLDGSIGERQVQGIFRVRDSQFPNRLAALYVAPFDGTMAWVPTTISNATLLVVPCPADFDDGTATGTSDGGVTIDDLLYYLTLFADAAPQADLDNGTGTGTPDGGITVDDLLYFLIRYGQGC